MSHPLPANFIYVCFSEVPTVIAFRCHNSFNFIDVTQLFSLYCHTWP